MKKNKRLFIRSRKLKEDIKYNSREELRKDFFELLKRAAKTTDIN